MIINGTVENIVYRNNDNGYCVLELLSNNKIIMCTGKFPVVGSGEDLELEGQYGLNKKYGEQFEVTNITIKKPTSVQAIEKYLASGLISGIGPVTSRNIVDTFAEDTLRVIEEEPTKLAEIKGISKRKALEVGNAYKEIKKMQEAVMFLQNYDVTIGLSVKIYDTYKADTIRVLQSNPYKLIEDIDGVGFKTADKIAAKLGIKPDSEDRIKAGILFVISNLAEKAGSTVVLLNDLLLGVCGVLEFGEDMCGQIEGQVNNLIIEGHLRKTDYNGEEALISSKNFIYEKQIASKLLLLLSTETKYTASADSLLEEYQKVNDIKLHSSQIDAIKCALNNGVSIITGGPGTGKTTIIKGLLYIFDSLRKKSLIMAPTGRAAKRLEEQTGQSASTIHRALEMGYGKGKLAFNRNENNPLDTDIVIIDEVSMLDVFLTSSLLKAIKLGTKVVFVGDKDQLPSVGAGNVLADMISSDSIPIAMLSQIFRQSESSQIIVNSHKINNSEMPDLNIKSDDFFYSSKFIPSSVLAEIVEMVHSRIPNFKNVKSKDIQVIAPMKAGEAGVDNINLKLQEKLNPAAANKPQLVVGNQIFRVGDKVMQISNNYELEWTKVDNKLVTFGQGVFNGDIGYIDEVNTVSNYLYVMFEDGRRAGYSIAEIGDLTLAYAITIHKSQGSEFPIVIIPILAGNPKLFNKNLLYTAVTRAKNMVVLIGKSSNIYYTIKNKYSAERRTLLAQFLKNQLLSF